MLRFVARRLAYALPVLFAVATITFFMMRVAPGGPFDAERRLPDAVERSLRARYQLDRPLLEQYARYMANVLRGDLGPSFRYPDRTVGELIALGLPVSLTLGLAALAVALAVGLPAGVAAAVRRNRAADHATMGLAMLGVSVPNFVLGPLLVIVFALWLGWLPVAGWGSWRHVVLPAVTLGLFYAAFIGRLTRAAMLEVIRHDFVRTARAKGAPERRVVWRHALRIALLPVVSFLGPAAARLLTGSVVVETIFSVPGVGRYFVTAALNRDYTMVLGTALVYSALLVAFNLLVDLAYGWLDPRIREGA
ncbi:MAG TPA: ABC transporter permease [Thermodesulfobacteriota bacterium]